MPPKKKLTDEQKQANFDTWRTTDEYNKIISVQDKRNDIKVEMGTVDIIEEWQPFLNELHQLTAMLKVPGRKAKCKINLTYALYRI